MGKKFKLDNFIIKFQFKDTYLFSGEPDKYLSFIKAKLFYHDPGLEDDEKPICVGIMKLCLIRLNEIIDDKEDLFFTLDSVDQNILQYYDALFEDNDIKDKIRDTFEQGPGINVLIIDKVRIHRNFRGNNLGLILALRCMKIFLDCAYFTLRPFPMQFSSLYKSKNAADLRKNHLDGFLQNEKLGFEKLTNYWMKLGFKKIPETDVYLSSSSFRTPTEIALFKK